MDKRSLVLRSIDGLKTLGLVSISSRRALFPIFDLGLALEFITLIVFTIWPGWVAAFQE